MHAVNVAIFLLDASFSLADFDSIESWSGVEKCPFGVNVLVVLF